MNLRAGAMQCALDVSFYLGGPKIWNRLRGGEITSLMYHGVSAKDCFPGVMNHYGYNVSVNDFERHIEWLNRHCNVVSLGDLLSRRNLSDTRMNVLITFDDGYENVYTKAFPILREHGCPGLIALPTAFVTERVPLWNDVIEFAVNATEKEEVSLNLNGEVGEFNLNDDSSKIMLFEWVMAQTRVVDQLERGALIEKVLVGLLDNGSMPQIFAEEDYRPLTKEQTLEMTNSGLIEFASHSVNHYLMAGMNSEQKLAELRESKNHVETFTETACNSFCVPGGSYDEELLQQAFGLGYECVLTSDPGKLSLDDRKWGRNCVFNEYKLSRFADLAHGPLIEMIKNRRGT